MENELDNSAIYQSMVYYSEVQYILIELYTEEPTGTPIDNWKTFPPKERRYRGDYAINI